MGEKSYFWLKLKDDFFGQKEIKMLRKIAGGDTYTIIYLKMLLLSLKNEGKIYYDGIADNMAEEVALEIDEEVENVQVTVTFLIKKGMIYSEVPDEFEMMNIGQMIGSESASAARVRRHRKNKALQSNNVVTDKKRLGNTEIEKEKELDKDIEKEIDIDLEKEKKQNSILSTFENEFNQKLSPIEIDLVNSWLTQNQFTTEKYTKLWRLQ